MLLDSHILYKDTLWLHGQTFDVGQETLYKGAGYLSLIKNKEAITFFLLNENAPNFGRAEGMARK